MMIWSDFEFVIHLACIIKTRILRHYADANKQHSLKKSCYSLIINEQILTADQLIS